MEGHEIVQNVTSETTDKFHGSNSRIYFLRQLFVCSGACMIFFVLGLCFGAPTVFIPQIRREANSSEAIDSDMASWLTSIHGYSALPFVIIIPIFTQYLGRKIPFLAVTASAVLAFIVFYWSSTPIHLLISEMLQGMLLASNMTLLIVIITEYSSPRYRGIFTTLESSIFFYGVWVANAIGTWFHWKNIGIVAFVCIAYCLTAVLWPESPSWLAMKGRFEECAISHHWLKGYDAESEKELENLISSQREYLNSCELSKFRNFKSKFKNIVEAATAKCFYQPILLGVAIISLFHFSGKLVCTMYAIDLVGQITKDEHTAYIGMLVLEGFTILGTQVGCVLSKYLKRRTLLLLFSAIGIAILYVIALYLYLIKLELMAENKFLSIALMVVFSVTISIGPMIIPCSLFGEIISLRYKSVSLLMLTLYSEFLTATVLKMAPHIFTVLTLSGAFLFYAVSSTVFSIILYLYLPETKDKTLQEIEEYFSDSTKQNKDVNKLME